MLHQLLFLGQFLLKLVLSYQWGSFDMLGGFTLTPETAFQQSVATSQCSCRALCIYDGNCYAFGVELKSPLRYACRLFNNSVNMTLTPSPNGLVGGPYIEGASLESDGFYYFVAPMTNDFNKIKPSCDVTFGKVEFRLALIKTNASFLVLSKYDPKTPNYIIIDLEKTGSDSNRTVTFGDGTRYEDSEIAKTRTPNFNGHYPSYFTLFWGKLDDTGTEMSPYYPLCQGNPLKLKI